MSKGTVRGTPGPTHGNAAVVINDDTNYPQVPKGFVLNIRPDDPPNFDDDVFYTLNDGDYIEFTITSYKLSKDGVTWEGNCRATRKITGAGIGIVRSALVNAGEQGTLMVTLANQSTGVNQTEDLTFTNNTSVALKQDDFVEFENAASGEMTWDAVRRIVSRGEITQIPGQTGLINVEQADPDNSGLIGTNLNFDFLPTPWYHPTHFNLRDTVEIDITDNASCRYVQLLSPSN